MVQNEAFEYLQGKIKSKDFTIHDFLGFYHENRVSDIGLNYLEEKGCTLYGKSLQEIQEIGPAFLVEIMHPEDTQRCIDLLVDFVQQENPTVLTYFQRLRTLQDEEYKLYLTCVVLNEDRTLFQCVTSPIFELPEFTNQIEQVLDNQTYKNEYQSIFDDLTKREKEIIGWVCQGYSTKEIAEKLFLSTHTVEKHKKNITSKTSFKSNAELIQFALNFGLM